MQNSCMNDHYNGCNEDIATDERSVKPAAVTPDTVENAACSGLEDVFNATKPSASLKQDVDNVTNGASTDKTTRSGELEVDNQNWSIGHGHGGRVNEVHPRINEAIRSDCGVCSSVELHELTTRSRATKTQNNRNDSGKEAPKPTSIDGNHLREVIVLSIALQLAFTSFLSVRNLQSSLNSAEGLGVISLGCLYGSGIIVGFATPIVIRLLGAKLPLIVAWTFHCFYIGANFYPTWATLIPASVILDLITPSLWTSHSLYITQHALAQSVESGQPLHNILSKYFGISFMLFGTAHIIGNLIASLALHSQSSNPNGHLNNTGVTYYNEPYDNTTYLNIIPNTLQFCGAKDCPGDGNSTATIQEPESRVVYILLGIFLAIDVVALLLTIVLLRPLKMEHDERSKMLQSLTSCCLLNFTDKRMLLLVPLIFYHSIGKGVLFADFTKSFISCSVGINMVGFVMTAFGAAFTTSSLLVNHLAHWTGRQVLLAAAMTTDMTSFVVMLLWAPSGHSGIWVLIAIAIGSGLAESVWQTQLNALISMLFEEDQLPPAYANMHTWRAVGFTVVFAYSSLLCTGTKLYIAMALLTSGALGYTIVEMITWKSCRGSMRVGSHTM